METRYYHRRLVPLGIHGNQPAIAAYCKVSEEEQAMITEALIQQKIGAASNLLKKIRESKDQRRQQLHGEHATEDSQAKPRSRHKVETES